MSEFVLLAISALVALHQYLPGTEGEARKVYPEAYSAKGSQPILRMYNDVREVEMHQVLPVANRTCRFFMDVAAPQFAKDLIGKRVGQGFGELTGFLYRAINQGKSAKTLNKMIRTMIAGLPENRLKPFRTNTKEIEKIFNNLCSKKFHPTQFSYFQTKEIFDFIQNEIKVLDEKKIRSLGNFKFFSSVQFMDRNHRDLGFLYPEFKKWVPYKKISKHLISAIIAAEDAEFFQHQGVQLKSLVRVGRGLQSGKASGGSTLTMQLLKNLFFKKAAHRNKKEYRSRRFRDVLRKVREWYWAKNYEKEVAKFTQAKEHILELYANVSYMGPNLQGVYRASQAYFGKTPEQLTVAEAAFMAATLKAPTRYGNPRFYDSEKRNTRDRVSYVLNQMEALKFISRAEKNKALSVEFPQWQRSQPVKSGKDFRYMTRYARSWVKNLDYSSNEIVSGLKVRSTIDSNLQKIVFDVTKKYLDRLDAQQNHLSRVAPALDDRGRPAVADIRDIRSSIIKIKKHLKAQAKKEDVFYAYAIYMGFRKRTHSYKKTFVENFSKNKWLPSGLKEKIDADVREKSSKLGDVFLAQVHGQKCALKSSLSFEAWVSEAKSNLSCLKYTLIPASKILQDKLLKQVRVELKERVVNRVGLYPPRKTMTPALYEGLKDLRLTLADGSRVHLEGSHQKYFVKKVNEEQFKTGNLFWVQKRQVLAAKSRKKNSGKTTEKKTLYTLAPNKLQASVVIMNSNNGEVLAGFGGYDPDISRFDRSRLAKRQPGSTLKPWTYLLALQKGLSERSLLKNRGVSFDLGGGNRWAPKNWSNKKGRADVPLYSALVQSANIPTVSLLKNSAWGSSWKNNLNELRDYYRDLGFYENPVNEPSIILGAQELSVLKLVRSFSFFANGESIVEPSFFNLVVDDDGYTHHRQKVVKTKPPIKNSSRWSKNVKTMRSLLVRVANRRGTASSMMKFSWSLLKNKSWHRNNCFNSNATIQTCFGGKTGTSNDSNDVWFIGFSRNFVIGIWLGYDRPEPMGNWTGGKIAVPLFQKIVRAGYQYLPKIEPLVHSSDLPAYKVCQCVKKWYSGNDYDYYLRVVENGVAQSGKLASFATYDSDGGATDKRNCEAALRINIHKLVSNGFCEGMN